MEMYELVGYVASGVLLISFLMRNIKILRTINSVGCGLFVIYGFMLPEVSWPVIITNVAIIFINFYYLFLSKK